MCRCNKEIVGHLLLCSIVAFDLWSFLFRSFRMQMGATRKSP